MGRKAILKQLVDIVLMLKQDAEEAELQKEGAIAYREKFPYVPQAYHDDIQDSGGAMSDTTPRKRGKKHWKEPDTRAGWDLEGEDTPPQPSKLHPNIGTDNWSVQAADEKELKRFPPNI